MLNATELLDSCVRLRIIDGFEVTPDHVTIIHGGVQHRLSHERGAVYARGILRHAETLSLLARQASLVPKPASRGQNVMRRF